MDDFTSESDQQKVRYGINYLIYTKMNLHRLKTECEVNGDGITLGVSRCKACSRAVGVTSVLPGDTHGEVMPMSRCVNVRMKLDGCFRKLG